VIALINKAMFFRRYTYLLKDQVWSRVFTLTFILFFLFLGDGILSYWAPNLIEKTFGSASVMGLVVSFSSIIGLGADLILPQIIKNAKVRNLLMGGVFGVFVFALNLILGLKLPYMGIFLLAMAVWGLYYEFFAFASQQFVADSVPFRMHSSSWAFLGTFKSLAYFLGPLIAGWVVLRGEANPALMAMLFAFIGFLALFFSKKGNDRPIEVDTTQVDLVSEIEHWYILFRHVWPVVILSLFMGLVDATFWTTGATWTQTLSKQSFIGGFFLPAYQLPSLFMGFIIAKWGTYKGKKKMAEIFLLLAGIFLALLGVSANVYWQISMVFISSIMLSVSYPMTDATYSDIISRMGRERKHLIGLSNSTMSLAYVVGPALAGFITQAVGARISFVVWGLVVIFVSGMLLLVTPKKLRLPQEEIQNWET